MNAHCGGGMVHVTVPLLETFLKFNIVVLLSFFAPSPSIAGLLPHLPPPPISKHVTLYSPRTSFAQWLKSHWACCSSRVVLSDASTLCNNARDTWLRGDNIENYLSPNSSASYPRSNWRGTLPFSARGARSKPLELVLDFHLKPTLKCVSSTIRLHKTLNSSCLIL